MPDRKTVFCVIAHPDDESFGPSGTLALLARQHNVHVVCVTDGASDSRFHKIGGKKLGVMRAEELQASAKILGVKQVHMLNYQDGTLNHNLYHDVADKLTKLVDMYKPSLLITMELRGASGHLDHVAVAMITSYVYREHRDIDAIWYHCTSKKSSSFMKNYFIFFPEGFDRDQVDMVVDIKKVFLKKVAAAKSHKTQMKDVLRVTAKWLILPKEEWFLVTKRKDTAFL